MSISSFAPAARMFGWFASAASAGSFMLNDHDGVTIHADVVDRDAGDGPVGDRGSQGAGSPAEAANFTLCHE
jgi:hypothetical protein